MTELRTGGKFNPVWKLLATLAGAVALVCCAVAAYHIYYLPSAAERPTMEHAWSYHFHKQLRFSQLALVCVIAAFSCVALLKWDRTVAMLKQIWLAVGHPMNLAIYRIVLFATILLNLDHDSTYSVIEYFAGLPRALYVPPTGMEHVLPWLPVSPMLAWYTLTAMNFFCLTAILGFFSRTSATLVVIFGLYALGIPQFFGQTNHYHHMFWFAAILAASRCGDYLSIDALFAARKRADGGSIEPPAPARAYSLPLRFIWILLGICYFFPGLWKYWVSGLAWAWSDNFQHLMEWKWINMDVDWNTAAAWQPIVRLDQHPILYRMSATIAVAFELSFIFLIFMPRLRYVAIAMGLAFHRITMFMMRIPFYTLQTSYVSLVNWAGVFGWIGRKARPAMTFTYDADNRSVRRVVASLRSLDLFGNVTYLPGAPDSVGAEATSRGNTVVGTEAYRALAARNPVMWLFWPVVYLLPEPTRVRKPAIPATPRPFVWKSPALWPVLAMALVVVGPNLAMGFTRKYHGWPFACYPLFEKMRPNVIRDFDVVALDANQNRIPWDKRRIRDLLTRPRYEAMTRRVREGKNPQQLHAFWDLLASQNPQLKDAEVVQFYENTIYSSPELRSEKPLEIKLVHQARLTEEGLHADDLLSLMSSDEISTENDED